MQTIWTEYLFPFLNSNATTTLVAIATAITVFVIYFLRRRDHKKDAANIILLEVKNAERNIDEARKVYEEARSRNPQAVVFPEKLRLMKTESWTKYKYLFVRDFEPEQWEEIGNFYENCQYFDEAVEHKDNAFRLNESEIRSSIHKNISEYAKEIADKTLPNPDNDPVIEKQNNKLIDDVSRKKELASDANVRHLVEIYNPDKSFNDASYYFNLLPRSITETQTGQLLKKLAGRK